MKTKLFTTLFSLITLMLQAGTARGQLTAPRQVLDEFVKAEIGGARLPSKGWIEMNRFFLAPSQAPDHLDFAVVSQQYTITDHPATKEKAAFDVFSQQSYGHIDAQSLIFKPQASETASGSPILQGSLVPVTMVASGTKADDNRTDVTQQPQWKIVEQWPHPAVGLDAAIRYVKASIAETSDSSVRANGEKTIGILNKIKR
jgi:hypothetical protein